LLTCVPVAGAAFQETSLEPADEAPENLIPATGEERAESRRVKELALELGALREKIEEEPDLRQRYTIYRRLMTMKRPQADIELIVHQAQRAWAARPPDAATLRDALYASSCGVHDRRIVQLAIDVVCAPKPPRIPWDDVETIIVSLRAIAGQQLPEGMDFLMKAVKPVFWQEMGFVADLFEASTVAKFVEFSIAELGELSPHEDAVRLLGELKEQGCAEDVDAFTRRRYELAIKGALEDQETVGRLESTADEQPAQAIPGGGAALSGTTASVNQTFAPPPSVSGPDVKPQESDTGDSAAGDVVSRDVRAPKPKSSRLVPVLILIAAIALATAGISFYRRHAK